jgi:hypothetical protein
MSTKKSRELPLRVTSCPYVVDEIRAPPSEVGSAGGDSWGHLKSVVLEFTILTGSMLDSTLHTCGNGPHLER